MSASHRRGTIRPAQSRRWSATSGIVSLAAAAMLVLAVAAPVLAHAELKSSDPEDKAVLLAPPTEVTLTFTEGLDRGKSSFKLNGPGGTVGTGKPVEEGGKVMALERLELAPGAYSIQWTAAANDGHVERGKVSFTVLEPTPAPPTPSPAPAQTATPTVAPSMQAAASPSPATQSPAATEVPAATEAPAASPAAGDDASPAAASGTDVLIPIAVGLVLVAGLGAFLLRRSRRA